MKKFSTWMILSLAVIFWILRIVTVYTNTMGMDFMIKPLNESVEISMIFIALISFIFIAKRKFLGAIIYMVGYWGYFGAEIISKFSSIMDGTLSANDYMSIFFSFIGVILPLVTLMDLLLDANRKSHPTDKKTDWFYKDSKFDRNDDDRADKNNYRTL